MELEHIYTIAEKHFFAKQYNDVKLDNIANELGIKKPSLYYYFTDKREFFIKTLKFSMKKYILALRNAIQRNNIHDFMIWYLDYPSKEKNLYAIVYQKGYDDDIEIGHIIAHGRQVIHIEMLAFFRTFGISNIRIYLLEQLLDKLAMDNCIEGYCLDYSLSDLAHEIEFSIQS